jgi:hypothetical protein
MEYKVGDITGNGFEVVDVYHKPMYKMRKRVTINEEVWDEKYVGESGWLCIEAGFKWVELDNFPNEQIKFRDVEYE